MTPCLIFVASVPRSIQKLMLCVFVSQEQIALMRHKQQLQLFQQPPRVNRENRAATPGSQTRKPIAHHLSTPDVHNRKSKFFYTASYTVRLEASKNWPVYLLLSPFN